MGRCSVPFHQDDIGLLGHHLWTVSFSFSFTCLPGSGPFYLQAISPWPGEYASCLWATDTSVVSPVSSLATLKAAFLLAVPLACRPGGLAAVAAGPPFCKVPLRPVFSLPTVFFCLPFEPASFPSWFLPHTMFTAGDSSAHSRHAACFAILCALHDHFLGLTTFLCHLCWLSFGTPAFS